jgi:hypothetical protein
MPVKAPFPRLGRTCGRRERETDAGSRRWSNLVLEGLAVAGGGRHPGLPDGGVLRGTSSERRSRSVRRAVGVSSLAERRTGDSGCPGVAEEGNDVRMRSSKGMHRPRETIGVSRSAADASFARSLDPCRSIATATSPAQAGEGGAFGSVSRSGKPGENQEEPAPGSKWADVARLAAYHRFALSRAARARVMRQKRKDVTASVPARIVRAQAECPHVEFVAKIGRRRRTPNKLGKRAPKRAVRVE